MPGKQKEHDKGRRHFLHLPSHSLKRYEVAGTISSDQLEGSHNERTKKFDEWTRRGGLCVCMYALHVLNFCGFRAVSEWFQTPSGGLADLDERNNLQTEKT